MVLQVIDTEKQKSILDKLQLLYGEKSEEVFRKIESIIEKYVDYKVVPKPWVTENDVILITYGDSIRSKGKKPLKTLHEFLDKYVKDTITSVHILPFYPYTSDDGFSVVNYRKVNPELGDWEDVNDLAKDYDLMFDAVINHVSKSSDWFQGYLRGEKKYTNYFIEADPNEDYSKVIRPRALPLLTPFETKEGTKYIWTTFSEDQIDLNYKNPDVLIEILDILMTYVVNGARYIRLDAIGFIWKELGTTCMHLKETHTLVKLMREIVEIVAPGTIFVTETNVPHDENISYFGNGYDEAHMVYQFPLPPLTLFSFYTKNASKLLQWLDGLEPTTNRTTFFNFLASHDGIGMRPTEGILSEEEKQLMINKTIEHGGYVSYKDNGDGTQSPYELNITYLDALTHPNEPDEIRIKRFLAAHTILLSVVGVPGIYIHSLLGSRNYRKGVEESGIYRRINREKLDKETLYSELESNTLRKEIFSGLSELIKLRRKESAFSPQAKQEVLFLDNRVFSILRRNETTGEQILVLVNVSDEKVSLLMEYSGFDIINKKVVKNNIILQPYEIMWIKKEES
jgi:glucosylglycerate phosphorylase